MQDDQYALACLRYIDRNAVKAGLVDHPAKWYLTSFTSYAYGQTHPILPLKSHPSYLALAKSRTKRRAFYLSFVTEKDEFSDELHGRMDKLRIFGSAQFVEEVIHGRDGKIQNKNSFGNDPCPPKDRKH